MTLAPEIMTKNFPTLDAKANSQIRLLWIACGKDDAAMKGARTLHEALDKAGIEHTFLETAGAHHWRVWRRYLRDLAPLLFRTR